MATVERPALSALVSPLSLTEFDEHWPDKVFVTQGEPARLPEFLRGRELSSMGAKAAPAAR